MNLNRIVCPAVQRTSPKVAGLKPSHAAGSLLLTLVLGTAAVPVHGATITIDDLTEKPITAVATGGVNGDANFKAEAATPEFLEFKFSVDGSVTAGTGVAVMFDEGGKVISDILEVSLTPRERGAIPPMTGVIAFYDAVVKFRSDTDPGGLNLADFYDLTDEIMKKILDEGVVEDGTQQFIGNHLIDIATGNEVTLTNLDLSAASDVEVPEPSSWLLFAPALAVLGLSRRRKPI
jgi:hypothetical protein